MTQRELTNRLNIASIKYYRGETTEFTDTEFDLKLKELQEMERESGIVYPDSPTQRVGSDLQDSFGKVEHPFPMLTIENTYNDTELCEWERKMYDEYNVNTYDAGVKYDGVSCELKYESGEFVSASTRGDKNVGDDITLNIYGVNDIPYHLDGFKAGETFYVRGEVLMPKSVLKTLNEEREANGEKLFANTRNACSGSLKQLDPKVTASRGLIFRPWDCFSTENPSMFNTMESKAKFLKKLGFKYEFTPIVAKSPIVDCINEIKQKIDAMNLDYDYDGIVIKVNNMDIQNEIGTKDTRAIEWGIARKWNEDYVVRTKLQGVEWQVGRTGVVTPVGLLEPVECGGVVISNVTLHNIDFIRNHDLYIGNILTITRSGGVIPYVLSSTNNPDIPKPRKVEYPIVCPVCGEPLHIEGALLKCVNEDCPAIAKGKILQFCSKEACDIKSIGEKVVDDLYEKGLIRSIEDILFQAYRACIDSCKENDIKIWVNALGEGYGDKSVRNMMDGMAEARLNVPYERILAGLSIPGVGKTMARALAERFDDVFQLERATVSDLMEIEGIAEKSATAIHEWIQKNVWLLQRINSDSWNWMVEAYDEIDEEEETPLEGLSVVFSGKSARFSGDEVEAFLESKGAKCGHSVSKKTNYLIVGEKPGASKVQKAKDCGVEIIDEDEFYDKFEI